MAVVALGVLGAYSFVSPHTRSTAAHGHRRRAARRSTAPATQPLRPAAAGHRAGRPSARRARGAGRALPVTVLNETTVTGLAAKVAGALKAGGWPTTGVGAYKAKDVAASTVFFTQGDEKQRAGRRRSWSTSSRSCTARRRASSTSPGSPRPGLVVVLTGDWKP